MNSFFKRSFLPAFFILLALWPSLPLNAQSSTATQDQKAMDNYKEQVKRLVGFLQFSLNTLGDPETSTREKEIIINESFLKAFMDEKVQIEDDLDENRETISYKDVQAYLKDVDFFFEKAEFNIDIKDIQPLSNDMGMLYFKVTTNRNLKGTTVEKQLVDNNQERFIEVNLDEEEQVLKIASIYTTKLNEREEQMTWWNGLPGAWKEILGKGLSVTPDITFDRVSFLNDSTILVMNETASEIRQVDTVIRLGIDTIHIKGADTTFAFNYDTLPVRSTGALKILSDIVRMQSLDISGNLFIRDLAALEQMTALTSLNISNTLISDLFPVRNLTNLISLNLSGTGVKDLDPIKYNSKIREIYLENTLVDDLKALDNFQSLETVHFSGTRVWTLQPLAKLPALSDLRMDSTDVSDLTPLAGLSNLELLSLSGTEVRDLNPMQGLVSLRKINFDHTGVDTLGPLSGLRSLQIISANHTMIGSLEPLGALDSLQKIYADGTGINGIKANQFMAMHPGTLVIYESETLLAWWQGSEPAWQAVFRSLATIDDLPTTEQLHALTLIESIDIGGIVEIKTLAPLEKITNLKELRCQGVPVSALDPLQDLIALKYLDCSETGVTSLKPLKGLVHLQELHAAGTKITTLEGLEGLDNLQVLNFENTRVNDLIPLNGNISLTMVYCDRTGIGKNAIEHYWMVNPACLVIYQSGELQTWWGSLPGAWKEFLTTRIKLDEPPSREQLQTLADLRELDLSGRNDILSLNPLTIFIRLEKLNIANAQQKDISPLSVLNNLKELNISNNPVTDLSAIAGLTGLTSLDISNTPVLKLDPLVPLKHLEYLNCSGTDVRKLDPLMQMFELRRLDIYNTGVSSLKALDHLPSLRQIRCYNTKLTARKVEDFKMLQPRVEVIYY
jgi:Leucine-rich repeat (LRR) protein